jgi:hypothetical protein
MRFVSCKCLHCLFCWSGIWKLQNALCNATTTCLTSPIACQMSRRADICSVPGTGSTDSSGGKILPYKKPAAPHILNGYIKNNWARNVWRASSFIWVTKCTEQNLLEMLFAQLVKKYSAICRSNGLVPYSRESGTGRESELYQSSSNP